MLLEEVNAGIRDLTRKKMPPAQVRQVAALQGATREDVLKLLSSLNINLNLVHILKYEVRCS